MAVTETEARIVDELSRQGYAAQFRAEADGLHVVRGGVFDPEDVVVEKMARFEGVSDPDDECVVFGLLAPDGTRGTWSATFGPEGRDVIDQETLRLLTMKASPEIL